MVSRVEVEHGRELNPVLELDLIAQKMGLRDLVIDHVAVGEDIELAALIDPEDRARTVADDPLVDEDVDLDHRVADRLVQRFGRHRHPVGRRLGQEDLRVDGELVGQNLVSFGVGRRKTHAATAPIARPAKTAIRTSRRTGATSHKVRWWSSREIPHRRRSWPTKRDCPGRSRRSADSTAMQRS